MYILNSDTFICKLNKPIKIESICRFFNKSLVFFYKKVGANPSFTNFTVTNFIYSNTSMHLMQGNQILKITICKCKNYRHVQDVKIRYLPWIYVCPEMEFLDINSTKHSSHVLHAIHSSFYQRILQKTILYSGFKNPYKKSRRQKKYSLFMKKHFVEREK